MGTSMKDKNDVEVKEGDRVIYHFIAATRDGYVEGTILRIYMDRLAILKSDDGWTNNAESGRIEKI